jgi:uncharacterized membrane protein YhaH (DUF805 family)
MDLSLWVLFGVVALLGVNQLMVRVLRMRTLRGSFWLLQFVNIVVGSALLWKGLPGFEEIPVISWAVGLLVFLHVAENTRTKGAADLSAEKESQATRRKHIESALFVDPNKEEEGASVSD